MNEKFDTRSWKEKITDIQRKRQQEEEDKMVDVFNDDTEDWLKQMAQSVAANTELKLHINDIDIETIESLLHLQNEEK